eukprot:2171916-Amphidinium_carterae.1
MLRCYVSLVREVARYKRRGIALPGSVSEAFCASYPVPRPGCTLLGSNSRCMVAAIFFCRARGLFGI